MIMIMIIIVIISKTIKMIKIVLLIAVIIITIIIVIIIKIIIIIIIVKIMINSPFQPGDFSTGFTTAIIIIYLVFSSLEELMQTKVYFKLFYSVWKETSQKPLKVAAATTSFSGVCIIVKTCFDECFLFHIITGRHYFLYKFVTQRFGTAAKCCERSLHFISVISSITFQCC